MIISTNKSSKENMAIDESLLKNFKDDDLPIIRFYTWKKDSVTIGVSQNIENYEFVDANINNVAKRITGGGVLFHGHDLSYSLVIPTSYLSGLSIKESYEKICTFLLNFYKKLGLNICYAKDDLSITLSKSEYCQVGFEAYDILANGKKIGGNAQRRTKKAIFQHGSIPLYGTKSNTFDEKIGLSLEDLDINLESTEAIKLLSESFKDTFELELIESELTNEENKIKNDLLKDKYDYVN